VVSFADVRILALGVLYRPKTKFLINDNARALLHPPGVEGSGSDSSRSFASQNKGANRNDEGQEILISSKLSYLYDRQEYFGACSLGTASRSSIYERLTRPLPIPEHAAYPFPTSQEKRWLGDGELEEDGMVWVGSMLYAP
jgi:hypothetical protein